MDQLIIGQVLAGAVAVVLIFLGEWLQQTRDRKSKERSRKDKRENLASAIHAELTMVWDRYKSTTSKSIKKATTWEDVGVVDIRSNYFSVFEGNASDLGLLGIEDSRSILRAYVLAKAQFDTLHIWTDDIRELEDLQTTALMPDVNPNIKKKIARVEFRLITYLATIKKSNNKLEKHFKVAIKSLEKYLPNKSTD